MHRDSKIIAAIDSPYPALSEKLSKFTAIKTTEVKSPPAKTNNSTEKSTVIALLCFMRNSSIGILRPAEFLLIAPNYITFA